jgi:hypothetical protein
MGKAFPAEPEKAAGGINGKSMPVHYCRECELACPVGKSRPHKTPAFKGCDDTATAGR